MRREFSNWAETLGRQDERLIFLTGDLGYNALEAVRDTLGPRFINAGVSEQNMITMAAALARQGLHPMCYSIAPFAVFRPYEQLRLDVALHSLPVKIVGNGGGYGYGIMGASHHALEDIAVLSCLPGFNCYVPICNEDVVGAASALMTHSGPGYLRLGLGHWPNRIGSLPPFTPLRRVVPPSESPYRITAVGLGPAVLNLIEAVCDLPREIDIHAAACLPLPDSISELAASVALTGQLVVVEEHAARGGLGDQLASALARSGVHFTLHHVYAGGYPTGRYGNQAWHQQQSGLDPKTLRLTLKNLLARTSA